MAKPSPINPALSWGGAAKLYANQKPKAPKAPAAPAAPPAAEPYQAPAADPAASAPFNPFDAAIETQQSQAQTAIDKVHTNQAAAQTALRRRYGADVSGQLNFTNPDDPYSRSAELMRQFKSAQSSQTQGQFGAGHGYDGSSEAQDFTLAQRRGQAQRGLYDQFMQQRASIDNNAAAQEGSFFANSGQGLADAAAKWAADNAAQGPGDSGQPAGPEILYDEGAALGNGNRVGKGYQVIKVNGQPRLVQKGASS